MVLKNTFKDVFDNTCNIGDYRSAHIFCPQTTQELPNKDHEAEPPEQLHKSITETLNAEKIAKSQACANERRNGL